MTDELLGALSGLSPRKLLDDLARIGAALAKHDRPRPEVELTLAGGTVVRGRIALITDDRNAPLAAVHVGGTAKAPAVTFVRIDQVVAVALPDATALVRAPVAEAAPPSRLELNRQIAARLDGLHAQLGKTAWARPLKIEVGTSLDDEERRAIGTLIPVLFEVLSAIVSDELGRTAIGAIEVIELSAGSDGEVTREAGGFRIRAPKLLGEPFTHQTLRRALERHL